MKKLPEVGAMKEEKRGVSRRQFIKGSVAVTVCRSRGSWF